MDAVDGPRADANAHPSDPAAAIGAELGGLGERPVADHVAVLERVNAAIAAELAALDEV